MTPYTSISDAAEATGIADYAGDNAEIWYYLHGPERRPPLCTEGYEYAKEKDELPDLANLEATHAKMGTIGGDDLDRICHLMQGSVWSPEVQALDLVKASGTGHTSMSMGDIIVVNGHAFLVDRFGFADLGPMPSQG